MKHLQKILAIAAILVVLVPFSAIPTPAKAAGALDASNSGVATGFAAGPRSITFSLTNAGNLMVCWVAIFQDTALTGTVSAMTYNSVAFTKALGPLNTANMEGEMWYLKSPTAGANTYSVTVTGATDGIRVACATFTGMDTTSPLGITNNSGGSSGNPAVSITTGTANSVSVSGLSRFANTAITASTFTNIVRANANNVTMTFDYNVNTTAASYTNTQTGTAAQDWVMGVAEFKTSAGGATQNGRFYIVSTGRFFINGTGRFYIR